MTFLKILNFFWKGQVAVIKSRVVGYVFFQVFMESRLSSESLEPMIGLLAYLKLKSWLKKQKLGKFQVTQKVTWAIFAKGHNSPAN